MSPQLLLGPVLTSTSLAVGGYEVGVGRTVPTIAAAVALISIVVGAIARVRPGWRRPGSVVALLLGLAGAAVGAVHAAGSAGGLGTGNGLAGAVAAVALGLVGAVLGGVTLVRARSSA